MLGWVVLLCKCNSGASLLCVYTVKPLNSEYRPAHVLQIALNNKSLNKTSLKKKFNFDAYAKF